MTPIDLEINQESMWRTLVLEQQTILTLAVEMLLRCHISRTDPHQDCDCTGRRPPGFVTFAKA
jgi:hypothetical protein